jgi:hypothetical protein
MRDFRGPGALVIGRVRARLVGPGAAPETAFRLRLGRLLGTASVRPPAMPPSAILIVRKLGDPLPGRLSAGANAVAVSTAWESAARGALAELYRRAARPYHEPAANPEAVRFADEAEMLACLLRDLSLGPDVAAARWWWRALLRDLPPGPAAAALLGRSPVAVPAVLHHLAVLGQLGPAVALLSPAQAVHVFVAVARGYELGGLSAIPRAPAVARPLAAKPNRLTGEDDKPAPPGKTSRPTPPWPTDRVPAGLGKEHQLLIGIGLRLLDKPAGVRGAAFTAEVLAWWQAEGGPDRGPRDGAPTSAPGRSPATRAVNDASPSGDLQPAPRGMPLVSPPPGSPRSEQRADPREQGAAAPGRNGSPGAEPPGPDAREAGGSGPVMIPAAERSECPVPAAAERGERPVTAARHPGAESSAIEAGAVADDLTRAIAEARRDRGTSRSDTRRAGPSAAVEARRPWEGGVDTDLAGVLYLINLMLRLDLPGCFEESWGLASAVGAWQVLDLLGRGLLTAECPQIAALSGEDPLWEALARLDGRAPGDLPGRHCPGNREFRLPPGWGGATGGEADVRCFWGARPHRLRLWTAAGALLVECRRDGGPARARVRAELGRYAVAGAAGDPGPRRRRYGAAPVSRLQGPLVDGLTRPASRWLTRVLPWLRLRLRRALGGEGPGAALRRPGRLFVTSMHVDLVGRVNDIWLPARRAGLDRDPGWVADLGRVVRFHFE